MLKHKLSKDQHAQLDESIQALYAEKDGEFYLQVEGMVPKTRLDEFRENNIQLLEENSELKKAAKAFGDMTADELAELQAKAASAGEVDEEKLRPLVDAEVNKRTSKMKDDYESQLASERENNTKLSGQLGVLLIDNDIQREAIKAGIIESAIPDVVLRARQTFKVVDGKAVPYNGDEIIYGKDGSTPMGAAEWLAERADDAPHWFKPSSGTGSRQQSQEGNGGGAASELHGVSRMNAARG